MRQSTPSAVLFTQQFVGVGTRKTGMVFWAEALARHGFDTYVVTVQLSALSKLVGSPRLKAVTKDDWNVWRKRGENLSGFIWVAPIHPARLGHSLLNKAAARIYSLYPRFLPEAVRAVVRHADLVVIESCSAVLLGEMLRALAPPHCKFVYCASDRLSTVGMHPMLSAALDDSLPVYDVIRVPARAMMSDFPSSAPVSFIPHGIDKDVFGASAKSPFNNLGPHVVVAGDMLFDHRAFNILVDAFPNVEFHTFGRMPNDIKQSRGNVHVHGEVPFGTIATYIQHANVGLAPYLDRPEAYYLAESSLKLIQYTYCRLPVVAPNFVATDRPHIIGYRPDEPASICSALSYALNFDRNTIDPQGVLGWDEVINSVLELVDLSPSQNSFSQISRCSHSF